ncbi:RHS repeat domain-containing protein [Delftia sp.]|uniref:RHS repeat domain-containing protein n=1 Tax=Delftia sp. TaxID=1886637 RepID=UPI00338FEA9F
MGRQIRITEPGGTVTELRYDARGQLLEQIVDPAGLALSTRYSYDAQGHALKSPAPKARSRATPTMRRAVAPRSRSTPTA